jgi:hypothetical protein
MILGNFPHPSLFTSCNKGIPFPLPGADSSLHIRNAGEPTFFKDPARNRASSAREAIDQKLPLIQGNEFADPSGKFGDRNMQGSIEMALTELLGCANIENCYPGTHAQFLRGFDAEVLNAMTFVAPHKHCHSRHNNKNSNGNSHKILLMKFFL